MGRVVEHVDEGRARAEHHLGPIVFDRRTGRFRATCRCGTVFGPLPTAGMVHGAFDAHCRDADGPGDDPMAD